MTKTNLDYVAPEIEFSGICDAIGYTLSIYEDGFLSALQYDSYQEARNSMLCLLVNHCDTEWGPEARQQMKRLLQKYPDAYSHIDKYQEILWGYTEWDAWFEERWIDGDFYRPISLLITPIYTSAAKQFNH